MRQLALLIAAAALVPAAASAQQRTVTPPVKWADVPKAELRTSRQAPPAPGVTWTNSAAPAAVRPAPAPAAAAPAIRRAEIRPAPGAAPRAERFVVRRHAGPPVAGHGPRRHHREYRRIERGHVLPHAWWGPRYHVYNWSGYGLPAPIHGGRWVRYYDDALMVDGHGRVHDGRWGMAWDEWDHEWGYDDRGVPAYAGEGDFYPGDEDYAWVEGGDRYAHGHHERRYEEGCGPCGEERVYHHGGPAYGYGYGGMVITETTVTTSPTVITETVYEEKVVEHRRAHRPKAYRSKRVPSKLRRLPRG